MPPESPAAREKGDVCTVNTLSSVWHKWVARLSLVPGGNVKVGRADDTQVRPLPVLFPNAHEGVSPSIARIVFRSLEPPLQPRNPIGGELRIGRQLPFKLLA